MSIFQNNITALQQTNPKLANKILQIETNQTFEVFASDSFENANILDLRDHTPIYIQQPLEEIQDILHSLEPYKLYKTLYFYGIGNGYLYKKLFENQFLQKLYLFEPELELIYIALNLTDISKEIAQQKIVITHTENFTPGAFSLIIDGMSQVHFKTYELHIHTPFYEKYSEDIKNVNKSITQTFSYAVNATGNDATDELLGLEHFIQNLPVMIQNPTLTELKQKGKITDTAIIVATGPSLAKQLPLLKKIQSYVTIISVDASLPILEKEEIKPDIVTSIERIALTGKFYEKTSKEFQEDIVFALTSIVDKTLLDNIKAGQLQLSMRPTGTHYYYMELNDWGYLGRGMSAANMAYELASQIGFETIVLIGQDLAYGKDGSSHAKNHIFGEDEVKHNDKKDDYITAYGGEGTVKTTWVWKLFLSGYEKYIEKNNQEGKILTINATEGGARIPGTKEIPFNEVIETYVDKSKPKSKIKLTPPTKEEVEKNLEKSYQKIERVTSLAYQMQRNIKKLLKEITQTINKYKKYDIKEIHLHVKEKETKRLVDKIAKIRNKYYGSEFESFYNFLISPLLTHLEYDIAYWSLQPERTQKERIHKNWRMIVFHHEWCYRIMVNLDAILKVIEEKKVVLEEALELEEA